MRCFIPSSGVLAALLMAFAAPVPAAAQAVASWESSIATLKSPRASGQTVRQFARISVGGNQLRVRFSNGTGTAPLFVSDVHVALPDSAPGSVQSATDRPVTFGRNAAVTIPPGAAVVSDAVDMPVQPLTRLAVSAFFRSSSPVQVGHLIASETNYLAAGDHAGEAVMAGAAPTNSGFYLTGLSAVTGNLPGGAVACMGDSITDGYYSTPGTEHRWPDRLAERLLAATNGRVGTIDAGLTGDGLLYAAPYEAGTESGLTRLAHDVLTRPGVHWMILLEGINDIIYPPPASDVAADLIGAYGQVIAQAHDANIKVFGATLTPFAGSGPEDYSAAKEAARQRVNAWIRTAGAFDGVFDFDAVVRDPSQPVRLSPAYDGGDHLHLNDAGYAALADSIPLAVILRAAR